MTLKHFSKSHPSTYRVIDIKANRGVILEWGDKIEIVCNLTNKHYFFTRKGAYNKGIAERATIKYKTKVISNFGAQWTIKKLIN